MVEKWGRRSKRRRLNFRKGIVRTRSSECATVSGDGQVQDRARNSSMFKFLKIPLPAILLLFGLYA